MEGKHVDDAVMRGKGEEGREGEGDNARGRIVRVGTCRELRAPRHQALNQGCLTLGHLGAEAAGGLIISNRRCWRGEDALMGGSEEHNRQQ